MTLRVTMTGYEQRGWSHASAQRGTGNPEAPAWDNLTAQLTVIWRERLERALAAETYWRQRCAMAEGRQA